MTGTVTGSEPAARAAAVTGALAVAAGGLVLLGWWADVAALKGVLPGYATMKANTAIGIALCGAGLWLESRRARARLAALPGALACVLGAVTLAQFAFGFDAGIDARLFAEAARADNPELPGRMAPVTALCLALLGASLALPRLRRRAALRVRDALAAGAALIAFVALLGYAYGADALYRVGPYDSIALHTAALLAMLACAVLAALPGGAVAELLRAPHSGGRAARWLLPLAVGTPLAIGWLRLWGEELGLYDLPFGLAGFAAAAVALSVTLVVWVARRLEEREASLARWVELVAVQNATLERVVLGAPLADTLDALLRDVERLDPEMLTSVLLLDEDGVHVRHGAAPRLPRAYVEAVDGLPIGPAAGSCGTAAHRREQVIVSDIASDPLWHDYRALALPHGLRACWSTPILDAEKIVRGTFAIYYREPRSPHAAHRQLIAAVSHTARVAIQAARDRQRLSDSEARLVAAQRSARIGSWELDVASDAFTWSREMHAVLGVAPAEAALFSADFAGHVHPADRARLVEAYRRARTDGEPGELDFRTDPARGPERVLHATFAAERDASGKVWRLAGTLQDVTERKRIEEDLRRALARQRELALQFDLLEEQERRKIGQELHDSIGQELAAAKLNLEILDLQLDPEKRAAKLADTRMLLQSAIGQSRDLVAKLRPPGLDEHGLAAALEQAGEDWAERLGIPVRTRCVLPRGGLSPTVKTALYRITQEALTNAAKHAAARSIEIALLTEKSGVRLEVCDDGRGFDAAGSTAGGHGLGIMRERAEAIGAAFQLSSAPGRGTRIRVRVPHAA